MNLRPEFRNYQNEVNCVDDSRDFKDAESVRSGPHRVPSQPALLPPYRDPGGMPSRSVGMLSRNDKPPFGTRRVYRETFLQIHERLLHHPIQEDSILGFLK